MPPVAIVTDTTHYLSRELIADQGIHQVSLWVNDGDSHERESDMPDYHAFYERLRRSDGLPTTSQPSIGDFLAVYQPLVEAGHDIVSVHISGAISGTVESARLAAIEAVGDGPRRVEIVDSATACAGLGGCALAGAAAARAGGNVTVVAERVATAAQQVKLWFAIDSLEYLRRGGRIGSAQAWVGGALKIKPILTVDREITPIERVRTSKRAFERLVAYLQARHADGADGWLVQHIEAPEEAEAMVERGREIFGTDPVDVSEIGPVIGTHTGPGLLGVCGLPVGLLR
jgi:DegV family protein with EDD domain